MTKKSNKKALAMSVLSLLLCCAMLVGSTFAWFSDTAKTGVNKIVAGNLDIELQYLAKDFNKDELEKGYESESWLKATEATNLFETTDKEEFLWEPGAMLISRPFRLANVGNLALTYQLSAKITKETTLSRHSLSEVIKMKVATADELKDALSGVEVTEGKYSQQNRHDIWANLDGEGNALGGYSAGSNIYPTGTDESLASGFSVGETDPMFVVLYWAPNADDTDNLYNLNNEKELDSESEEEALMVEFGLEVFATQTPFESDSFDENYDENAMAQHEIAKSVESGIHDLANSLKNSYPNVVVTELEKDEKTGGYKTSITGIKDKNEANMIAMQIGMNVASAIDAQAENIKTITIDGNESKVTIDYNGKSQSGFTWLAKMKEAMMWSGVQAGTPVPIPITVTDMGGTAVTYTVNVTLDSI